MLEHDPLCTNPAPAADRAERARRALLEYMGDDYGMADKMTDADYVTAIGDLIGDLGHLHDFEADPETDRGFEATVQTGVRYHADELESCDYCGAGHADD